MRITCLVTSDVHGYIRGVDELSNKPTANGFSRVVTYLKKRQKSEENLVLIENGDFLEGSILANSLATRAAEWQIHPFVKMLNELHYDSAVPGNHEFNYGISYLEKALKGLEAPYLAANVVNADGTPHWKAYQIIERSGVKIAVIGLVTSYVTRWEKAGNIEGLSFLDPISTAKKWTTELQEKVQPDLILLAYHGGLERDMETGEPTEYMTGENVGYRLATEVSGISGVITGHQHRTLAGDVNGIPLLQPGTRGASVGEMTFDLVKEQGAWQIAKSKAAIISVGKEEEDKDILTQIESWEEKCQVDLQQPLKKNQHSIEPEPIEMLHKIQQISSRRRVSVVSLSRSTRSDTSITMETILENYTFPCTFAILRFSVKELKDLLIEGLNHYQLNEEGRLSPFALAGQKIERIQEELIDGLVYRFVSTPEGKKVELLDLADSDVIEISFNHYLSQVNQHRLIGIEKIVQEIMIYMPDLMREYQLNPQVDIPVHGQGFYPGIS